MVDIGKQIRRLREDQHLTQEELGRRAGVDPQTVYRYEAGSRLPSLAKLEEIAKALSVEPQRLLEAAGDPRAEILEELRASRAALEEHAHRIASLEEAIKDGSLRKRYGMS